MADDSQHGFGQGFGSGDADPGRSSVDNTRVFATDAAGRGQGTQGPMPQGDVRGGRATYDRQGSVHGVGSVVGDDVPPGSSNVSGGVARRKRRGITGLTQPVLSAYTAKNYRTSAAVMFNNFDELVQDTISREYAQEIIEEVFDAWGVPVEQGEAAKYAEDLLFMFLIAVTASNKANYDVKYDVPIRGGVGSVEVDFAVLSKVLEAGHGVTRRQFARAVSNDLKYYLKQPENQHILPVMATRVGCEPAIAYLAFDGSTHCTGLTSREIVFTKTLESRNLFERDDVVAQGSSDKLMQGMSGGVRSVSSR